MSELYHRCTVRTTFEIDRDLLDEAVAVMHACSMREAIETALRESIQARRRQELLDALGTVDLALTQADLARMRDDG